MTKMVDPNISFPLQAARDCDLCEGHESVNWRCLTCPANMCDKCYGLHKSRKNFKKHETISIELHTKQRKLGFEMSLISKCPSHPQNDITLDCVTCGILVCHVCVASKHNGHIFEDLQETLQRSKDKLNICLEKLRQKEVYSHDQISKNSAELSNVESKAQRAKDEIIKSRDSQIASIVAESDKLIEEIEFKMKENKNFVSEANSKLQSFQNDIEIIEKDAQNQKDSANSIVVNYLLQEARSVDIADFRCNVSLSVPKFLDEASGTSRRIGSLFFDEITVNEYSSNTPLPHIKEISTVQTRTIASELRAISPTQIWYSYFDEGQLHCFDRMKENTSSLSLDFKVKGFVIYKDGYFFVCNVDGNCLMQVTPEGNASILCSTYPQKPWGICLNNKQQPVVCMDKSLVVFSSDCQVRLHEFSNDRYGNPLFVWSYRVAMNGKSDYCVADIDGSKVVTIDNEGELKWTYSGRPDQSRFIPWNICCDKYQYVFVADTDNNKVHMLDAKGQLIMNITENVTIEQPRGLTVTHGGILWIGEENDSRTLHIVKYLKDPWET